MYISNVEFMCYNWHNMQMYVEVVHLIFIFIIFIFIFAFIYIVISTFTICISIFIFIHVYTVTNIHTWSYRIIHIYMYIYINILRETHIYLATNACYTVSSNENLEKNQRYPGQELHRLEWRRWTLWKSCERPMRHEKTFGVGKIFKVYLNKSPTCYHENQLRAPKKWTGLFQVMKREKEPRALWGDFWFWVLESFLSIFFWGVLIFLVPRSFEFFGWWWILGDLRFGLKIW